MARPKMKPCPYCHSVEHLAVYTYEKGTRHVECDKCHYLGPACTNIAWAIRHHNAERDERAAKYAADMIVREVAELPDRTSPDDAPDMMLVKAEELRLIVEHHFPKPTP